MKSTSSSKKPFTHKKGAPAKNKTFGSAQTGGNRPPVNKKKFAPKKSIVDPAPQKEVVDMFMSWFRKHKTVGQVMTKQDVVRNILVNLNAKQEDALADAMKELKSEGFIEIQEDGVTLVLTQMGVDYLK
ncbi:MAG: hypothetical protein ABIJ02_10065 [Pseudomonadota bacterium]|jgi:hypothetical protein